MELLKEFRKTPSDYDSALPLWQADDLR